MKKNQIALTVGERKALEKFSATGVHSVRLVKRAKIILALDTADGRKASKQEEIAQRLELSRQAINNVKRDFLEAENVPMFLQRKKRATPPVEPKVTGELEARIIALACSKAPQGYAKWTLRLLASKCVELQYADSLSHMTVSRLLKKRNLNLI
jgi:hypothetical protein